MNAYRVYRGSTPVLEFGRGPGALVSTAPPPPPDARVPLPHPFLHGAALDAAEEGRLSELLDASSGFDDFVERLERAGYRLEPQP